MSFFNNIKSEFGTANMLNKLIYINVFSFLLLNIFSVIFSLFLLDINSIKEHLMLPSNTEEVIKQPWSLVTYMFIHDNFIHLIFNLIWLHFGGKLFLQYLNQKQLFYTYIDNNSLLIIRHQIDKLLESETSVTVDINLSKYGLGLCI